MERHLCTSSFCYNPCLISRRVVICLHRLIILLLRQKITNKSVRGKKRKVLKENGKAPKLAIFNDYNTMCSYNIAHSNNLSVFYSKMKNIPKTLLCPFWHNMYENWIKK